MKTTSLKMPSHDLLCIATVCYPLKPGDVTLDIHPYKYCKIQVSGQLLFATVQIL